MEKFFKVNMELRQMEQSCGYGDNVRLISLDFLVDDLCILSNTMHRRNW
jgi:hypothetical protein